MIRIESVTTSQNAMLKVVMNVQKAARKTLLYAKTERTTMETIWTMAPATR